MSKAFYFLTIVNFLLLPFMLCSQNDSLLIEKNSTQLYIVESGKNYYLSMRRNKLNYSSNSEYLIEVRERTNGAIFKTISFKEGDTIHFKAFDDLADFLCNYKDKLFKTLVEYNNFVPVPTIAEAFFDIHNLCDADFLNVSNYNGGAAMWKGYGFRLPLYWKLCRKVKAVRKAGIYIMESRTLLPPN
jgi:hypothetical protein